MTKLFVLYLIIVLFGCKSTQPNGSTIKNSPKDEDVKLSNKPNIDSCNLVVAASFINYLQSEAFLNNKRSVRLDSVVDSKQGLRKRNGLPGFMKSSAGSDSILKEWTLNSSPFKQSGAFTPLFNIYKNQVLNVSKQTSIKIDSNAFYLLSHYTDEPNAKTFKIPNCNKNFIFMNDRFAIFCYEFPRNLLSIYDYHFYQIDTTDNDLKLDINYSKDVLGNNIGKFSNVEKFAGIALFNLDLPSWYDSSLVEKDGILTSFLTKGMEVFTVAHELSHIALRHKSQSNPIYIFNTTADSLMKIDSSYYSWAQELQADFYGTILLSKIIKEEKEKNQSLTCSEALKWSPLIMMTNIQLFNFFKLIKRGVNAKWEEDLELNSCFKKGLLELSENPTFDEFHKLLNNCFNDVAVNNNHPPEYVRKEVIKFALFKQGLLSNNEYNSFNNLASQWHLGTRSIYNYTRERIIVLQKKVQEEILKKKKD